MESVTCYTLTFCASGGISSGMLVNNFSGTTQPCKINLEGGGEGGGYGTISVG